MFKNEDNQISKQLKKLMTNEDWGQMRQEHLHLISQKSLQP